MEEEKKQTNGSKENINRDEQVRGYHETMYVTKSGIASVNSGSTASTAGYVYYSASCTSGTMTATVQYYNNNNQKYENTLASRTISSGESFSGLSAHEPGAVLFRLALSGMTGRGNGSIQGYD